MNTHRSVLLAIAGLAFATAEAGAQQAPLASDQVSGPTLQLWLDQKVAYAGTLHGPGCYFMNAAKGEQRVIFFTCPDGNTRTLEGTVRVQGNEWCTSFPLQAANECVTWHALPDGRFAQKRDGATSASVYMLSIVPVKAAAR